MYKQLWSTIILLESLSWIKIDKECKLCTTWCIWYSATVLGSCWNFTFEIVLIILYDNQWHNINSFKDWYGFYRNFVDVNSCCLLFLTREGWDCRWGYVFIATFPTFIEKRFYLNAYINPSWRLPHFNSNPLRVYEILKSRFAPLYISLWCTHYFLGAKSAVNWNVCQLIRKYECEKIILDSIVF